MLNVKPRTIICRDNIDVLRGINSGCIDLIYLDPPFNKNKKFTAPIGSSAEGAEFSDIFREEDIKDEWVKSIEYENPELHSYLTGVKAFSNRYNYCYLVYMAIRFLECQRVLKDTGSIYLHCDPTMSHYLKIVMDCIFGENNFRNEIVWGYRTGGMSTRKGAFARKHDVILFYSKTQANIFTKLSSKSYALTLPSPRSASGKNLGVDEDRIGKFRMVNMRDWWVNTGIMPDDDIREMYRNDTERTGYPTQKPLALLERIIKASSREGDVVLDPFCGCATTCVAAEKLGRGWIGVDVSLQAYELVNKRLDDLYAGFGQHITSPLLSKTTKPHFTTSAPRRGKEPREQGYIYIISNANWQGCYKVGIAKDPQRRLNSYQTSDPYRAYKLEWKIKTANFREIEQRIHSDFHAANEWINEDLDKIKKAITKYAKSLSV